MKKLVGIFGIILLLSLLLCVTAFAAPDENAIYDVNAEAGVTFVVQTATGDAVEADGEGYYAGGEKIQLTVSGLSEGSFQLVLALTGDAAPDKDNIKYIDQQTAAGGAVTFTVYPSDLTKDVDTYYLKLANADGFNTVLTFKYYEKAEGPALKKGDADGNGSLSPNDALTTLKAYAGLLELDSEHFAAADADGNGSLSPNDALQILKAYAGLITLE